MSTLISELMQLQRREGWLSPDGLRGLAEQLGLPLYRLEGAASFYTHFRREPPKKFEIEVCRDLSCQLAGGKQACERLRGALGAREDVEISEVSCIGRCDSAPAANVGHRTVRTLDAGSVIAALEAPGDSTTVRADWNAADVYRESGADGYAALRSALVAERDALSTSLSDSGMRGMGAPGSRRDANGRWLRPKNPGLKQSTSSATLTRASRGHSKIAKSCAISPTS